MRTSPKVQSAPVVILSQPCQRKLETIVRDSYVAVDLALRWSLNKRWPYPNKLFAPVQDPNTAILSSRHRPTTLTPRRIHSPRLTGRKFQAMPHLHISRAWYTMADSSNALPKLIPRIANSDWILFLLCRESTFQRSVYRSPLKNMIRVSKR